MPYFHQLLLSFLFSTVLVLPQLHFVISLNSAKEISSQKTDSQNCANAFLKPRICAKDDDDDARHAASNSIYRLVKVDGVKVGHVREMKLNEDKTHRVVTRSLRPLLFEIPEFLSRKECEHFIQITQRQHLKDSETVFGRGEGAKRSEFEKTLNGRNLTFEKAALCRRIQRPNNDADRNGKMSLQEFIAFIDYEKHVHPTSEDALPIFRLLDADLDGFVLEEECLSLTEAAYVEFLYHIEELKIHPRYYIRFSETATLPAHDPLVRNLRDRIAKLTGLSRTLIEKSEPIQVRNSPCVSNFNMQSRKREKYQHAVGHLSLSGAKHARRPPRAEVAGTRKGLAKLGNIVAERLLRVQMFPSLGTH